MAFREFEAACEQNPTCSLQKSLSRLKCVRECISPICYQQIYYQDQELYQFTFDSMVPVCNAEGVIGALSKYMGWCIKLSIVFVTEGPTSLLSTGSWNISLGLKMVKLTFG
nr:uncharacterized protein LOC106681496 isoform X2 [Halyomorpha halys]